MLSKLNSAQREAVTTRSGPMLVLAGAGTGKTRVVTFRVAELIRSGIAPDRILAVTFTNKAAAEMRERSEQLLGKKRKTKGKVKQPEPEMSTFHSLCVRILRRHADRLGYPKRFSICDRGDQESAARTALREIRAPNETLRPADLLFFISLWKSQALSPTQAESVAESDKEHLAVAGYRRYQKALQARGAVDFDDLLLLVERLFKKFPKVRQEEAARFDHIMVDEYQDTNQSQYEIVRYLALGHQNLCVVGDDDQSIYGWRGADVEHILKFAENWRNAKVVRLEDNYRSTEAILNYANTLIAFNSTRHDKVLRAARKGGAKPRILQFQNENEEAEKIVLDIKSVLSTKEVEPRDIAILFRTNEQPRPFEGALRQADIPYVLIGSSSFFDRKEIRDLLSYLKVIADPSDEPSLLRILNVPARGIGGTSQKKLLANAVSQGKTVWETLQQGNLGTFLPPKTVAALASFRETISNMQLAAKKKKPSDLISFVLEKIDYQSEVEKNYTQPLDREARLATLEEIVQTAKSSERKRANATLDDFLTDIALGQRDDDDKEKQLRQNAVALMTLHSAKGLEFPHAYLVGMEEGILPHKRSLKDGENAIAEERRLCYVGVTRAMERLTLSLALTRKKWGKQKETIPSRFLFEMTGQAENWTALQRRKKAEARRRR